jgi:carboxypeptidase C (cathepsin A)
VGDFIRLFTTRYERWASPKFLIGESYGTPRSAGLAGYLQGRSTSMYLNGIVLISAILNFQTARFAPMNDSAYMLFLPTYTADAWYHKKLPADLQAKDLPALLDEARTFALEDYALALLKGNTLEPAAREAMARKVARFTGLSPEFVANANLRISLGRFTKELLRGERRTIGRLDGRFKGFDLDAAGETNEFDPANAAISGPFPAALNSYVRAELKYRNDTPYAISGDVRPWSYDNVQNQYLNTAETLRGAMAANQFLRVFVANGYFDGATPFFATEYTFFQTDLAGDLKGRIKLGYYEAGHMMYIHRPSHAKLKADVAEFIKSAAGGAQ